MKKTLFCIALFLLAASTALKAQEVDSLQVMEAPQTNSRAIYSEADMQAFQQMLEKMKAMLEWQNPDQVISMLGNLDQKTVADIGAGSGYFTFKMARQAQKVIAIDVDFRFLDYIENKKSELNKEVASNIETRLALPGDAKLDPREVDVILIVNSYPFIESRVDYFKKVRKSLRDNGYMMIVSFKKGELPFGPDEAQKVSSLKVASELKKAGFNIEYVDDVTLPYQYIVKAKL